MPTLRTPAGPIEFEPTPYEPSKSWIDNNPPRFLVNAPTVGELAVPEENTDTAQQRLPPHSVTKPAFTTGLPVEQWAADFEVGAFTAGVPQQRLLAASQAEEAPGPLPNGIIAFQAAIMEAQGKNLAELQRVIALQNAVIEEQAKNIEAHFNARIGLGISHDRAVARVAELEALLQAASDKPAPAPPTPAADSPPAAKNPEAFARSADDRARQDASVGRWASR